MSGRLKYLLLFALVGGAVTTGWWLIAVRHDQLAARIISVPALCNLLVCIGLVTFNLAIRWLRWHFLVRRFSCFLTARDSVVIYFATLPALFTPLSIGEVLRVLIIRRRFPMATKYLVAVWIWERLADVAILLCFLLLGKNWVLALLPLAALLILSSVVPAMFPRGRRSGSGLLVGPVVLLTSLAAWLLPVAALAYGLSALSAPISLLKAGEIFSSGTLLGGLTGLPMGISIAGSSMIHNLTALGIALDTAVIAVLIFRLGTVWYAVALGVVALLLWQKRLLRFVRREPDGEHFDNIAAEYEDQIPAHIRQRLLTRKIDFLEEYLEREHLSKGARGLDLGCGQGWYMSELRGRGYEVSGVDRSQGQLIKAAQTMHRAGGATAVVQADASDLPFEDDHFDFIYSINVMHHVVDPGARKRAFAEIIRVLRPGGIFLLHETNTINPLFRLYLGYVFPLIKKIDEGTEVWLLPNALPQVSGGRWREESEYFTFLPDFIPRIIQRLLGGLEAVLEKSRIRHHSAHFLACLVKDPARLKDHEG